MIQLSQTFIIILGLGACASSAGAQGAPVSEPTTAENVIKPAAPRARRSVASTRFQGTASTLGGGAVAAPSAPEVPPLPFTLVAQGGAPAPATRNRGAAFGGIAQDEQTLISHSFSIDSNGEKIDINAGPGDNVNVLINNAHAPKERYKSQEGVIEVFDKEGKKIASFRTLTMNPGGQWKVKVPPTPRGYLGVTFSQVDESLAAQAGIDPEKATLVTSVVNDSAAAKAGILRHDIITNVDGAESADEGTVRSMISKKKPGDELKLKVLRKGSAVDIAAKLDAAPASNLTFSLGGTMAGGAPVAEMLPRADGVLDTNDKRSRELEQMAEKLQTTLARQKSAEKMIRDESDKLTSATRALADEKLVMEKRMVDMERARAAMSTRGAMDDRLLVAPQNNDKARMRTEELLLKLEDRLRAIEERLEKLSAQTPPAK